MLTPQEQRFVDYWQQNRDREKKLFRQLLIGLPAGLLLAIGIVASLVTGRWYQLADMEANTQLNPNVLIIAILAIVVFVAIFYKKFQWDQKEQLYQELLSKQKKEKEKSNEIEHG
jgi:type VI protein secretion system component VasK